MKEIKISLVASFLGIRFIPMPFVLAYNNMNPKLIFKENEIEYRSFIFTKKVKYEDVKSVDVFLNDRTFLSMKTTNLCLEFHNSIFTFAGNLNNIEKLKECLVYLSSRSCLLSKKASNLL